MSMVNGKKCKKASKGSSQNVKVRQVLGERLRLVCLVYTVPAASYHLDDGFQSLAWVSSCGMSLQSTQVIGYLYNISFTIVPMGISCHARHYFSPQRKQLGRVLITSLHILHKLPSGMKAIREDVSVQYQFDFSMSCDQNDTHKFQRNKLS